MEVDRRGWGTGTCGLGGESARDFLSERPERSERERGADSPSQNQHPRRPPSARLPERNARRFLDPAQTAPFNDTGFASRDANSSSTDETDSAPARDPGADEQRPRRAG